MTPFTTRGTVHPSDPDAIRRITSDTGFFRPDEIEVAVELAEEYLAKGTDSGYSFWFAETSINPGFPVGYVCFGPTPCTLGSFDLYWIAVDRSSQGTGLGKILTRLAEQSAESMGGRKMYIETSGKELYAPTQEFYRKAGYCMAARLYDFYDVGDDKLIFEKDLQPHPPTEAKVRSRAT